MDGSAAALPAGVADRRGRGLRRRRRLGGRPPAALGDAAAFSFHPRKSITTGEGGMLTTNDAALADRVPTCCATTAPRYRRSSATRAAALSAAGVRRARLQLPHDRPAGARSASSSSASSTRFIDERDRWAALLPRGAGGHPLAAPAAAPGERHGTPGRPTSPWSTRTAPLPRNEIMAAAARARHRDPPGHARRSPARRTTATGATAGTTVPARATASATRWPSRCTTA